MTEALATPDFFAAVLELQPRIVVFDCDGTLWSGDAGSGFMKWTIETGLLSAEKITWINARYAAYKAGEVDELAICGEMVQVYAGLSEQALRQAAAAFFREFVEPNIFPELRDLIAALQANGTEIWAVSSTNDWVIEEGVQRFNISPENVLCARVGLENGVATDRLLDVPTDQGKVQSLYKAGVRHPDAVFGNSIHDAAMLGIARRAFPVNPTPALAQLSAQNGWRVYLPGAVRSVNEQ